MVKQGELRVWWIPQVPMKAFYVRVKSVKEAIFLMDVLADYDIFQFENKIKPDYSNVGGLQQYEYDSSEWLEYYDDDGRDIDQIKEEMNNGD
jgi:hypothetical protein